MGASFNDNFPGRSIKEALTKSQNMKTILGSLNE